MTPRRVLITGGAGLLGSALAAAAPDDVEVHVTQRRTPAAGRAHTVELSDAPSVLALMEYIRPDTVIHTAYGKDDGERDIVAATRAVARATASAGADLIHVSTDIVFGGDRAPYDEADPLASVTPYGRWKAQAERDVSAIAPAAAIVRTSLIVSVDPLDHGSRWIVGAIAAGETVRLFTDVLRCPIHLDDLTQQLWELAALPRDERAGAWHLVGPDVLSRYDLGVLIAQHHRLDAALIVPALASELADPPPLDLRLADDRARGALPTRPHSLRAALAPQT